MMLCAEAGFPVLRRLLGAFGLALVEVPSGQDIPHSYWGAPEAGLCGAAVHARTDTPVHSLLHEASHALCMGPERRALLDTDAGGDFAEEDAVLYLQVLLAPAVPGCSRERMCEDMDAWGYTFRLGSAARWFNEDAAEAREWLMQRGVWPAAILETLGVKA
ncbi:MAG: hypothetical protein RJB26_2042 [Pseudomonadota bacterium]|jgi:hypothetical protein